MPNEDSIRTAEGPGIDVNLLTVMIENERLTLKGLGPLNDPHTIGSKTMRVTLEGRRLKYTQALRNFVTE